MTIYTLINQYIHIDYYLISICYEGSYLRVMKEAREREKKREKYTTNDYRTFQKNYGLGPSFLEADTESKQEKSEKARKREEYAKKIREANRMKELQHQLAQNNLKQTNNINETTLRTNNHNDNDVKIYQNNSDPKSKKIR